MPTSLRNICSSSISTASEASTAARIRTENRLAAGDTHFTSALWPSWARKASAKLPGVNQRLTQSFCQLKVDDMSTYLAQAMEVSLDDAVRATNAAAANEAFLQAQRLLGDRPETGAELDQWNAAVQILAFRIEHAAGGDALGAVVGLRRWGFKWDEIGQAVGMSRQAAHSRWAAQVRQTLDRYGTGELGGPVADDEADLGS